MAEELIQVKLKRLSNNALKWELGKDIGGGTFLTLAEVMMTPKDGTDTIFTEAQIKETVCECASKIMEQWCETNAPPPLV